MAIKEFLASLFNDETQEDLINKVNTLLAENNQLREENSRIKDYLHNSEKDKEQLIVDKTDLMKEIRSLQSKLSEDKRDSDWRANNLALRNKELEEKLHQVASELEKAKGYARDNGNYQRKVYGKK